METARGLRVEVDPDLCIGSGDCVRAVPAAFDLDEDLGIAIPRSGAAAADVGDLLEAARACPTQAIRVRRDGAVLHESN